MKKKGSFIPSAFAKIKNNFQDLNMQKTLLGMFFGVLLLIWLLPILFLGSWALKNHQDCQEKAVEEALFYLRQAKLAYLTGQGSIELGQPLYAQGTLVIKDNGGEILYASDASYSVSTLRPYRCEAGSYNESGYDIYYQKANDQVTIFYILGNLKTSDSSLVFFSLLYTVLCAGLFFLLKKKIYDPICTIEVVLTGASKGKTNFTLDSMRQPKYLSSIFKELNALLNNIQDLMVRESNAQLMKKEATLDALQSQINPHFLYNTLDCIRGQALRYGTKDIEIMTLSLSKFFRYSISNANSMVTLEEELNNVNCYLLIQQIRFSNRFIKKSYIDEDTLNCLIPKLILQPIIENAIHHGLESKLEEGTLTLKAYITEQRLVINVKDNGCGMSQQQLERINQALAASAPIKSSKDSRISVGLSNVNSRIKFHYGDMYGINVYSTQGIGTDVQINLPLITQ
ncbi:MAG: sensor histidine kinase [Blautia sp.]|jgi:two-component system sensor histidine kinase YesM